MALDTTLPLNLALPFECRHEEVCKGGTEERVYHTQQAAEVPDDPHSWAGLDGKPATMMMPHEQAEARGMLQTTAWKRSGRQGYRRSPRGASRRSIPAH